MAYERRTWYQRLGQGLNKFLIGEKDAEGKQELTNAPDSITQQGDVISADNLNDLEDRIGNAFEGLKMTKVWENPDPTQDIGETDFTISREIPEMVIKYRQYKGNSTTYFIHISGGTSVILRYTSVTLQSVAQYYRPIIYTISNGTTSFLIRNGAREQYGESSIETNNSWMIPVAIYSVDSMQWIKE